MTFKRGMGWKVDPPDLRDYCPTSKQIQNILLKAPRTEITIPTAIDNRKYCPPIRDQASIGSCVAFASCAMYEYLENKVHGKHIEGSELFVYKMARLIMKVHGEGDGTGDTGSYLRSGVGALAHFGMPPEAIYPYEIDKFDQIPGTEVFAMAEGYQALKYLRLDPHTEPLKNLSLIKEWITKGFSVTFGFSCYQSALNQAQTKGEIPYPNSNDTRVGGHAVLAVGFDDNKIISNTDNGQQTTGAFLIRNSWGTDWGEQGYGYIPYEYLLSGQGLAQDWWTLLSVEWIDSDLFHF